MLLAGDVGCLTCKLFAGLKFGQVEMVASLIIYLGGVYLMEGSIFMAFVIPALAFVPSLLCHLLFERGSSTIHKSHMCYPTYSCIGSIVYLVHLVAGWEPLGISSYGREPMLQNALIDDEESALADLGPAPASL